MDISRWTIDERMQLPDYCFGQRFLSGVQISCTVPSGFVWRIADKVWPDPACIWSVNIICRESDHQWNWVRFGLADTVPTSSGEMDAAQNILPEFGNNAYAPPAFSMFGDTGYVVSVPVRKGIITGGKRLVVEAFLNEAGTKVGGWVGLNVSALPKNISGYLANQFFTEVR